MVFLSTLFHDFKSKQIEAYRRPPIAESRRIHDASIQKTSTYLRISYILLTSRKSTHRVEICERRKTYRPLIALIDESTGDKTGGGLSCFHFNFYPLMAGPFLDARWRTLLFSSLFHLCRLLSLSCWSLSACGARGSWARQAMVGGEIEMIEHVNVWLGLHRRDYSVVNESVYFPAA